MIDAHDELIIIALGRSDDDWSAQVQSSTPGVEAKRVAGDGPGDVLERIGQDLDAREAARLTAARGLGIEQRSSVTIDVEDEQRAHAQDDPRGEADR